MIEIVPREIADVVRPTELMGSPVVGLTSPEFRYFLWRSYRKMARAIRLFQKKLEKKNRRANPAHMKVKGRKNLLLSYWQFAPKSGLTDEF